MSFKWNDRINSRQFWDFQTGEINKSSLTDKELVNSPDGAKFEDLLRAACNVLSELIELEENRIGWSEYLGKTSEEKEAIYDSLPPSDPDTKDLRDLFETMAPGVNTYEFRGKPIDVPPEPKTERPDAYIEAQLRAQYEAMGWTVNSIKLDSDGKINIDVSKKDTDLTRFEK